MAYDKIGFFIDDYKLKVDSLNTHFARMWTRFHFFLTIESALFGLILYNLSQNTLEASSARWIAFIGILSSLIWYALGAQDRYHVVEQRQIIEHTFEKVKVHFALTNYYYAVQTKSIKPKVKCKWYQWKWGPITVTKLVALIPLFVFIMWILIFVFLPFFLENCSG